MADDGQVPFISVVIPAYNEERYIRACLAAVLAQEYPADRVEVLVIDNGSTDATASLAAQLLCEGGRGQVLGKSGGTIASVRNFGWRHARGEVLAFLDGDSVPDSGWLRQGIALLRGFPDASCVGFAAAPPLAADSWVERAWFPISSSGKQSGTKRVRWLSSFNLLVRREYFERVGGFDERLVTCEDADLGARLSELSQLIFSDLCRVRHLGTVKTLPEFFRKEFWRGQNNFRSFVKSNNKKAEFLSVAVPVLYLATHLLLFAALVAFLVSDAVGVAWPAGLFLVVLALPLLLTLRSGVASDQAVATSLLFMIYLLSRGLAVVRIQL